METQKYYDFNNGVYCVHFANRRGLSIEEITQIFAPFGHVNGVTKAGDDYGYRFVKYKDEEDVIRCVEGMKDHPFIRLKVKDPSRKKTGNRAANNCDLPYGQTNYNNDRQRTESRDCNNRQSFDAPTASTSIRSPENNSRNLNSINPTVNSKTNFAEEPEKKDASKVAISTKDVESKANKPSNIPAANFEAAKPAGSLRQPEVAAKNFMPVHTKTSCSDTAKTSGKVSNEMSEAEKYFAGKPLAYKPKIDTKNLSAVDPPILSQAAVPVPEVCPVAADAEVPRLVTKSSGLRTAEITGGTKYPEAEARIEPPTETAQEVVVANIHSDYGVHYILHLIQKHDPLCVSEMKMIPTLGLRYCIIYLQSQHQAYAIEKEFDKFQLCGKELIVLRPQKLAQLTAVV